MIFTLSDKFSISQNGYFVNDFEGKGGKKMDKVRTPFWSIKVQQIMIERGMNKKELAKVLRVNYTQLCNVMSGTVINENIENAVKAYFEL